MEVLKAGRSKQLPSTLSVAWAVESVAALGGYLEHRRNTPIYRSSSCIDYQIIGTTPDAVIFRSQVKTLTSAP
jgi:hypothetical protein